MKYTFDRMIQRISFLSESVYDETAKTTLLSIMDKSIDMTTLPWYMDDLDEITAHTFEQCTNLALTSLPEKLLHIGDYAFRGCTNLALISLPEKLKSIGYLAFYGCTNMSLSYIPSEVSKILSGSFSNCTSLTTLTFKGTPTIIAIDTFSGCDNLTTINVPWAEGEVANAPWCATNATINYNYVEPTE